MKTIEEKIIILNRFLYTFYFLTFIGMIPVMNVVNFNFFTQYKNNFLLIFYIGFIGIFIILHLKDKIKKKSKIKINDELDNNIKEILNRNNINTNFKPKKTVLRIILFSGYLIFLPLFTGLFLNYYSFLTAMILGLFSASAMILLCVVFFIFIYNNFKIKK